jgi:glutamate-1-semialdehyde 2,1-aminomutase
MKKNKKGIKLYRKAKKIIPGGTMLFSKKPELYSSENWPTYYKKAKGCYVWDLNNRKFLDMLFLVGTNTLGYSNNAIDNQVIKVIKNSNMSTLNAPEEVALASKLIRIHPWANQVRFTRGGGEANAAIIRIARASTKKQNIAFCGYHGWHDWYLSSSLNNKRNLDKHLMTNLKFEGVLNNLKNSCYPFNYNDFEGLKKTVSKHDIGIIIMEVTRNYSPKNNFLKKIRALCNTKKIILIFDECTSGFRENLGGKHLKFKVYPDLAMFGKAMGNGYAINAIIGKKKYMKNADKTFISSTFWTERVGSVAALSTINYMEKYKTYKKIIMQGQKIKYKWKQLSKKYNLSLDIISMDAIPIFIFKKNHNIRKKYITNEMLKEGILASNIIYVSIFHNDKILNYYFQKLEKIFYKLSNISIKDLKKEINNSKALSHFKRMN